MLWSPKAKITGTGKNPVPVFTGKSWSSEGTPVTILCEAE